MVFREAKPEMAYLKAGLLGFAGTGKTFTATQLTIGLHKHCMEKGLRKPDDPVFFLDTETGSDWVREYYENEGIQLLVDKTMAFTRLVPAIEEVTACNGILVIDSLTHFWKELCASYCKEKGRDKLTFGDWAWVKGKWSKFTTAFVNSPAHILLCGRAGFEYDFFTGEDGKKELEKTGIKMKAEGETGYEPSLLILMDRVQKIGKTITTTHTATVLKDRSDNIDGSVFTNPTFESFLPHVEALNLGGEHVGVDTSRNSRDIVPRDYNNKEKFVVLDEITAELLRLHPSRTKEDMKAKADLIEEHFGSRSWERIKLLPTDRLKEGFTNLKNVGE